MGLQFLGFRGLGLRGLGVRVHVTKPYHGE